jgi:hypothetical protein
LFCDAGDPRNVADVASVGVEKCAAKPNEKLAENASGSLWRGGVAP